jgi:tripartite-type tricarboxylate transporter receptor subunit TctC
MTRLAIRALVSSAVLLSVACFAQTAPTIASSTYPSHPIRMIVPFAPGGPTDAIARIVAQKMSERLGRQIYVENHGGAAGNVGTEMAAKAPADGYTILIAGSNFIINPSLYAKLPYDPLKDFRPVTLLCTSPNVLAVHPSVPARTVKELIALVKESPGKYSYASAGTGTTPHISGEMLRLSAGLDLVHVPFGGGGPAITSTLGGHTQIIINALPPMISPVREGGLRALAVLSGKRARALPDVPTMAEAGMPGLESDAPAGVLVRAGTPDQVVDLLHRELVAIIALPDVRGRLAALGFEPVANKPEEFAAWMRAEITSWSRVIRGANIHVE